MPLLRLSTKHQNFKNKITLNFRATVHLITDFIVRRLCISKQKRNINFSAMNNLHYTGLSLNCYITVFKKISCLYQFLKLKVL